MSKFKIVNIVDLIFIAFATFLIIFAWVQFFVKNILLSLFISATLSISILLVFNYFKSKKQLKKQALFASQTKFLKFKLAIQTMSNQNLIKLIKKLIPSPSTTTTKGDIRFIKDEIVYLLTFFYCYELNSLKLMDLIKTKNCSHLIVFCSSFNKDAEQISTSFKNKQITLISLEQLYDLCNKKGIDVDISNINLSKSKITIKTLLKTLVSRHNSKGYFISGLVILFTSLLIPYRIYYVVVSSILFILSALCRFKPVKNLDTSIFD